MGKCQKFLVNSYLFLYNVMCAALWMAVLYKGISALLNAEKSRAALYYTFAQETLWFVMIAQSIAVLEIVQAATGMIRSSPITTTIQVLSRLQIVFLIWLNIPESRQSIWYVTCVGAWTFAELIRYPFYALNIYNLAPYWLKWLRYSGFLILYPLGIASEVGCIWLAFPALHTDPFLSAFPYPMPNKMNFQISLGFVYIFVLIAYFPFSVQLMNHMLVQRNKFFSADTSRKKYE